MIETLKFVWSIWVNHGTKLLGFAQVTIGAIVAVDGLIPAGHLKYWMMALGLSTAWRGFTNSRAQP